MLIYNITLSAENVFFHTIWFEKMTKNWQKVDQKNEKPPVKPEVLHEKLKTVLPMGILKKKISTPNFTKFLNP